MSLASARILGAGLFLLVPVAVIQPKGLAPLGILVAVALAWTERAQLIAALRTCLRPAPLAFLLLGGWGVASSAWSITPSDSLGSGVRLVAMISLGLWIAFVAARVDARGQRVVRTALLAGLALGAVMLGVEAATTGWLGRAARGFPEARRVTTDFTKPAATVAAVLVPLALRAGMQGVAVASAAIVAVLVLPGEAARLGLLAGLAVWGLVRLLPRAGQVAMPAVMLCLLVAPPLLDLAGRAATARGMLSSSSVHRVVIWDFAAQHAAERPVLGWGIEASRAIPGGTDNAGQARLDRLRVNGPARAVFDADRPGGTQLLPLHPHNAMLQMRLELGWVGLGLAVVAFGLLGRAAGRIADARQRAAGLGALAAALTVALLAYGAWQAWWLIGLSVILGAAIALRGQPDNVT